MLPPDGRSIAVIVGVAVLYAAVAVAMSRWRYASSGG